MRYRDRLDAADQLAGALKHYQGRSPLVLAIPRGGLPIGRVVADRLGGELDVVLVRKLGAPGNPEYALGAVDESGRCWIPTHTEAQWQRHIAAETQRQLAVIRQRRQAYSAGHPAVPVAGRIAIVVDDGLATGATMVSALEAVRQQRPARLVCAVPVGSAEAVELVRAHADEVICLRVPPDFYAVGAHYAHFDQVEDEEAIRLLRAPAAAP